MENRKIVLIVDDVELNRAFLRDMLEDEYQIIEASNGLGAIDILQEYETKIAVVLLDAIMPEMDGFEVLEIMNKKDWIDNIPVVMISAETSPTFIEKGYALGVTDYISRPFSTEIVMHRVHNTIMLYTKQKMLQSIVKEQIKERERNNTLMVDILSTVVEFRNGESGAHVRRIRVITEILLECLARLYPEYNINVSLIALISNAAALHDVGKIMIPEEILNKPAKLTTEEFQIMKTHTLKGAEMLMNTHTGKLEGLIQYAHDICRWHHERWDGNGYPDGLKGDEIPLCAQVVSIADVYDALVSERVYKRAYTKEKALEMIKNGECGIFNPRILDCLLREADVLEEKIYIYSDNYDRLFDIDSISKEIMTQRKGTVSERTVSLLEEERAKYQSFAALSDEVLFEFDITNDILILSEAGTHVFNLPLKLVEASSWFQQGEVLAYEDYQLIYKKISESTPDNPLLKQECYVKLPGNIMQWMEITIRTLWSHEIDSKIYSCIGKIVNIHEQKEEKKKLKLFAELDPLTQLYNRRTSKDMICQRLEVDTNALIMFLDIDDFKKINDSLGHMEGDLVLKKVARCIELCTPESDVISRIGGDEFLIYIEASDFEILNDKVNTFWESLKDYFTEDNLRISMGIARYPNDGMDFDMLVALADQALYEAKRHGKDRFYYYHDIT